MDIGFTLDQASRAARDMQAATERLNAVFAMPPDRLRAAFDSVTRSYWTTDARLLRAPDAVERDRLHLLRARGFTPTPYREAHTRPENAPQPHVRRCPASRGVKGWIRRGGHRPLPRRQS